MRGSCSSYYQEVLCFFKPVLDVPSSPVQFEESFCGVRFHLPVSDEARVVARMVLVEVARHLFALFPGDAHHVLPFPLVCRGAYPVEEVYALFLHDGYEVVEAARLYPVQDLHVVELFVEDYAPDLHSSDAA